MTLQSPLLIKGSLLGTFFLHVSFFFFFFFLLSPGVHNYSSMGCTSQCEHPACSLSAAACSPSRNQTSRPTPSPLPNLPKHQPNPHPTMARGLSLALRREGSVPEQPFPSFRKKPTIGYKSFASQILIYHLMNHNGQEYSNFQTVLAALLLKTKPYI